MYDGKEKYLHPSEIGNYITIKLSKGTSKREVKDALLNKQEIAFKMNCALDLVISDLSHASIGALDIEPSLSGNLVNGDFFYTNKRLSIRVNIGELERLFEKEVHRYSDITEIERQIIRKRYVYIV